MNPGRAPAAILIVALVAMALPTLAVFANSQFAGWQPAHGHIGSGAAVANHTHPYDVQSRDSDTSGDGVVFTPSDDGSITSALTLTHPLVELSFLARGAVYATVSQANVSQAGRQPEVPVPPPRA